MVPVAPASLRPWRLEWTRCSNQIAAVPFAGQGPAARLAQAVRAAVNLTK